jgi:hypothetical protein
MITTILEVLVAVVVLIVIIAVAALHFLRADDSDTFDEMPDEPRRSRRHPAEPSLEPAAVPADRGRSRQPAPAGEQWAGDDRGQAAYGDSRDRDTRDRDSRGRDSRGRDSKSRPAKPERRGSPAANGQRPAPVPAMQGTARQAKSARQADADSETSSWDKLSDVDYWAELAADKPLTPASAASSDSPRPPRRGADKADTPRSADVRPSPRGESAPRGETAQLPVRQRAQSRSAPAAAGRPSGSGQNEQIDVRAARAVDRYGTEPATQSLAALARLGDQPPAPPQLPSQAPRSPSGQRPATGQRAASGHRSAPGQRPLPQAPAAQISHSGGHARPPQPLDDDPLTSPSFPAINTSDSRSYRTRRPSSSPSAGAPPSGGRGSGGYSEPAQSYSAYPATPDRSASVPNGYPVQPAPVSAAGSYPAGPVANPYGSYVSTPQPGYQEAGTSHLDAAAYGSGYAAGQQAVAGANWYSSPPDGSQAVSGYLPAPGSGNGIGANGHSNGAAGLSASGYDPSGYGAANHNGHSGADYGVRYQTPAHQGGQPAPTGGYGPGYPAGPYDQRGYGTPDLSYGQDGYQGYPGYGGGR